MSWTDEQIDNLFQEKANDLSFEYKGEYWQELSASLPVSGIVPSSNISDEQIDEMFQEASGDVSVEYKPEYWQEMETMLPAGASVPVGVESLDTQIDDLYRKKSEELKFDYKPEYFSELDALLPLNKWRTGDLLWFASSFIFLGLLVMTPFMGNYINSDIVQSPLVVQSDNAENNTAVNDENVLVDSNSSNENNSLSEDVIDPNVSNSNQTTNPPISNNPRVAIPTHNSNKNLPIEANENNLSSNNDNNGNSGNGPVPIDGNNINSENNLPPADLHSNNTNISNPTISEANNTEIENVGTDVSPKNNSESALPIENNTSATSEVGAEIKTPKALEKGDVDALAIRALIFNEVQNEFIDKAYNFDFNMPTRSNFYLEATGGISQSLITPSDKMSYSYGMGIGAHFQKGKFTLLTGLNATISNHKDIQLNREAKKYGFGSELISYNLNYKQLYTLEAKIVFGYKMGRHGIDIGVRPSYVVGSKVGMIDNVFDDEAREEDYYGHMDGIRRFGIKPTIGYSFDFNNKWMIGLNVGTQLMPSVNEDYIDGFNNKLPFDAQFILRRSFSFRR